jgi:hypothetical protein
MNIIGVKNPYALVQKAGKRKARKTKKVGKKYNKSTKKNRKTTNCRLNNTIFL